MQNRNYAPNNNIENTNSGTASSGDSPVNPVGTDSPLNNDSQTALNNDSPQPSTGENPQAVIIKKPSELNALIASLTASADSLCTEIRCLTTSLQKFSRPAFSRDTSEQHISDLTDVLVADAVNGPSTRSNFENDSQVVDISDIIEPLHFNPNSRLENLLSDGAEIIPGFTTDRATARSYLPFPAKAAYVIRIP